jgi:DNA-binding NarL/FixJ family response regulator
MNTAVRQSSQQVSSSNLSSRQMLQLAPLPIAPVDFAPAQISAVARHARVRVAADNILLRRAYFESEGTSLLSGALRHKLGLTRREQQLVPLIARGLTNKEIANHFCLSEQTVKNHLCRMKHRVGADNRLGIVQTCHLQGFLL